MTNLNRKLMAVTLAATGLSLLAGSAFASNLGERQQLRVDKRQAHQQTRINQGIASGQLTPAETARLEQQQAHIDRMEVRTEADGKVTAKEAARMEQAQDHASRTIYRKKHNLRQVP